MPKKIMIITYNDTGGCFVENYHEGDISVKQKERAVTDKDGNVVATIPTHQNIKMKKMKECEMTSDDLINIIDHLKVLKDRCAAKEIRDIVKRDPPNPL